MLKTIKRILPKEVVVVEPFAFEMRERIYNGTPEDGELIFDSGFYTPNALTNEGQAHMLNVWAREQANLAKWLNLLNMPGAGAPVKTTTMANMTEAVAPGTNGYARQQIVAGDWGAPALDAGDMQISAAQKTFGQFTGNVPVSHVGLVSAGTGTAGTFFLWVSTAFHTANNTARTFVNGESYLVTLRDKQI
jgi:hypothetical protein